MALSDSRTAVTLQNYELKKHGTFAFPVACYETFPATDPVPWHWHNDLELIVIRHGTVEIELADELHTLTEGEGVFINSNVLHTVRESDCPSCRLNSIVFHPRFLGGSPESIFWERYLNPLIHHPCLKSVRFKTDIQWHQQMIQHIQLAWNTCVEEPAGYEFHTWHSLSEIILSLVQRLPLSSDISSKKSIRNNKRIKYMLQFIQEHYDKELTLEQIAKSALISKSECLRCFRQTIGISPMHYIRQLKMQKAAELLKSTSLKISEIAERCGFSDLSYFSKTFRIEHGCTPKEYRNKYYSGIC